MLSPLLPLTLLLFAQGGDEFSIQVQQQDGDALHLLLTNPSDDLATLVVDDRGIETRSRIPAHAEFRHIHHLAALGEPLEARDLQLWIESGEVEQVRITTEVIDPVVLPNGPMLSLLPNEIDDLKAKRQSDPRVGAVLSRLIRRCDGALQHRLAVPNHGGAWTQLYRCPDTGVMLEMVNYHLHRSPATGKTYSGYPYDQCITTFRHKALGTQAWELALAWRLTDDLRYAERAREILVEYAYRYESYQLHDRNGLAGPLAGMAFPQTLDEAMWLIDLARALDLLRGSGVLDASDLLQIHDHLMQPAVDLLRDNELGVHNIQNWHNAAQLLAGIQCGDLRSAHLAAFGPSGLEAQLAGGVDADGFWFEGSPAYHFFTVQAMLASVQPLCRAGVAADWSGLDAMFRNSLELMQPDASLPMVNDGGRIDFYSLVDEYEEAMVLFANDTRIDDLITVFGRSQELDAVLYGPDQDPGEEWSDVDSINFATAGLGALRSGNYWKRSMALVDYGPHGGHHGHLDKLGLTLWMQGSQAIREAGSDGYGTKIAEEFFPSTLAHSTLLVDGLNQRECRGQLGYFVQTDDGTTLTASANQAYAGIAQRRLVHLTAEGHLADLFEASAAEDHVFDYVLHGTGTVSTAMQLQPWATGFAGPYDHLSNVRGAWLDGDIEVTFNHADGTASTVRVLGEAGSEVILADAPGFPIGTRHPVLIVRRHGTRGLFTSLVSEGTSIVSGLSAQVLDDGVAPELHLTRPGVEGESVLKF